MQARTTTGDYREPAKATIRLVLWTLAWAATLASAKFGPELVWNSRHPVASWAAVAVNLAIGIGWIVAFTRFLQRIDELQRKVMQEALAISLGSGWVVGFAYVVADAAGLITYDVNIAVLPALLGVVFMIAFAAGMIRYR
ncbi:hypothetical protein Sme01_63030 [Sphaerisporangium melleum]|uniref:Uncharacterized protein n=1 Tax=Sphaerisporangium melleum TaxID=321316 RepID=A0A917R096_9ACTN|nr:hypothetical protein [Sphaerisporangium melleum]GGK81601.1 hypothetical protein GCM10007964_25320 [Sphaerisporangium melleum]GII73827.1 hypothetical protein Sme01_63030 [Sphaerisporangium melleum]